LKIFFFKLNVKKKFLRNDLVKFLRV
jgi:hypothetical protein